MNDNIQILVDAWEQRPRRQLDYSGLTESSVADLEWTNNVIKSLIKAVPDIREKFGVHPTAEIVMPFTIKPPIAAPESAIETILTPSEGSEQPTRVENAPADAVSEASEHVCGICGEGKRDKTDGNNCDSCFFPWNSQADVARANATPATQPAPDPAAGSDAPSKKASTKRGKGRNSGSRVKKLKAARTASTADRKPDSGSTSASEPAKPSVELPVALQAAPSSAPVESAAANPQPEPPAPTLMSIG